VWDVENSDEPATPPQRQSEVLAATAVVHGLVLETRNVNDMRGCGVQVLNPFKAQPTIKIV
jgi:hypothetical protein